MKNRLKEGFIFISVNYFVLLVIFYLGFLVTRLFCERIPLNPLILTGIFFAIFLGKKYFLLLIKTTIDFYKMFLQTKELNENKEPTKIKKALFKIIDTLENFLFYEVLQYCYTFYFFSLLSFCFLTFYNFFLNRGKIFCWVFLVFPWFCFICYFFKDVLFSKTGELYQSLYWLTFNILLWRVLKLGLILTQYDFSLLKKTLLVNNFPDFYGHELTENFFIANPLIREHFFFKEPLLNKKRSLKSLWKIFVEIQYWSKAKQQLEFLKIDFENFLEIIMNINIVIFGSSFILIWLNQSLILHDLFIVALITFSVFVIFLLILNLLIKQNLPVSDSCYFLVTAERLNLFFDTSFLKTREELLARYKFLKISDLPYPYILQQTPVDLDIDRGVFFDRFSKEEREYLNEVCHDIFVNWYSPAVLSNEINFETLSYKKKPV